MTPRISQPEQRKLGERYQFSPNGDTTTIDTEAGNVGENNAQDTYSTRPSPETAPTTLPINPLFKTPLTLADTAVLNPVATALIHDYAEMGRLLISDPYPLASKSLSFQKLLDDLYKNPFTDSETRLPFRIHKDPFHFANDDPFDTLPPYELDHASALLADLDDLNQGIDAYTKSSLSPHNQPLYKAFSRVKAAYLFARRDDRKNNIAMMHTDKGRYEQTFIALETELQALSHKDLTYQSQARAASRLIKRLDAFVKSRYPSFPIQNDTLTLLISLKSEVFLEWNRVYYTGFVISDLRYPQNPDGDLPEFFRWSPPSLSDNPALNTIAQNIFDKSSTASDSINPDLKAKTILDTSLSLHPLTEECQEDAWDFAGNISDASQPLSAAGIKLFPSKNNFTTRSSLLSTEINTNLGFIEPIEETTAATQKITEVVQSLFAADIVAIKNDSSPMLLLEKDRLKTFESFIPADEWDDELTEQANQIWTTSFSIYFDNLTALISLTLARRKSYEELASAILTDFENRSNKFSSIHEHQYRLIYQSIKTTLVSRQSEILKALEMAPPEYAKAYQERFDQVFEAISLIANNLTKLAPDEFLKKTAIEFSERGYRDHYAAATDIARLASSLSRIKPANLGDNLAIWPEYQSFVGQLVKIDPEYEIRFSIKGFLENKIDAGALYEALTEDTSPLLLSLLSQLLEPDTMEMEAALEKSALIKLGPELAETFVNRLRYVFYSIKYLVEDAKADTVIAKAPNELAPLLDDQNIDPENETALVAALIDSLNKPDFIYNHRDFLFPYISLLGDDRVYLYHPRESDTKPSNEILLHHLRLLESLNILDSSLITAIYEQIPDGSILSDSSVRFASSALYRWRLQLENGWPNPDGTSPFTDNSDENAKPDIYFLPDGLNHLSFEIIVSYFQPNCPLSEAERFARLAYFFTDYENGYYRYFCPYAKERNSAGLDIKAVRDHTLFRQLISVLKAIKTTNSTAAPLCDRLTKTLSIFLKQDMVEPFWTITDIGSLDPAQIVRHEAIQSSSTNDNFAPTTEERLSSIFFKTQYEPFKALQGEQPTLGRVKDIVTSLKATDYRPAYFSALSTDALRHIRDRIVAVMGDQDGRFNEIVLFLDAMLDLRENPQFDPDNIQSSIEFEIQAQGICERLNEFLDHPETQEKYQARLEENLPDEYQDSLIGLNQEIMAVDKQSRVDYLALLYRARNRLLLTAIDPILVGDSPNDIEAQTAEILGRLHLSTVILEDTLNNLPIPPAPSYFDWFLSTASTNDVSYLYGKLLEIASGQAFLPKRKSEIARALTVLSKDELRTIADLANAQSEAFDPSADLNQIQIDARTIQFYESWSPSEKIWIPALIKMRLAAEERGRNGDDDVYFSYVSQIDIDHYLESCRIDSALDAIRVLQPDQGASLILSDDEDELSENTVAYLASLEPKAALHTDTESYERRKRLALDISEISNNFTLPDQLYILMRLSQKLNHLPNEVMPDNTITDLKTISEESFHQNVCDEIFESIMTEIKSPYEIREIYTLLRGNLVASYHHKMDKLAAGLNWHPGLLTHEASTNGLSEAQLDKFWKWLEDDLVTQPLSFTTEQLPPKPVDVYIQQFDAALSSSIESHAFKVSQLDIPTMEILRITLDDLMANETDGNRLTLEKLYHNALFEPFDAEDPIARAMHSRFNPNGYYKSVPVFNLADLFTLEHYFSLRHQLNLPINEDSNHLQNVEKILLSQYQTLIANDDTLTEASIESDWMSREAIQGLEEIFPMLNDEVTAFNRIHNPPVRQDYQSTMAYYTARLHSRPWEITTLQDLELLQSVWAFEGTADSPDIMDTLFKPYDTLSSTDKQASELLHQDLLTQRANLMPELHQARLRHSLEPNDRYLARISYLETLLDQLDLSIIMTESAKHRLPATITKSDALSLKNLPVVVQGIISSTTRDQPNGEAIQKALSHSFFMTESGNWNQAEINSDAWEIIPNCSTKELNSLLVCLRRLEESLIVCRYYNGDQFMEYQSLMHNLATVEAWAWASYHQRLGLLNPKKAKHLEGEHK